MGKKPQGEVDTSAPVFTKEQLIGATRYADRRDLLQALLSDGESYSFDDVDRMIQEYMEGGIN